ncbi:hypothetical protein BCR34DRAFT_594110 [Clohesyomyces aquaticus]|uniref:Uncharacterized protein n=1 Tax=Clohesyomyces aquaticus TaxID=1231657 RepID=A0A1Y1YBW0_9PLEO|nr:hypothetical protein BCR34DRAFT_594110 [Clohesyomyces aquaticus]
MSHFACLQAIRVKGHSGCMCSSDWRLPLGLSSLVPLGPSSLLPPTHGQANFGLGTLLVTVADRDSGGEIVFLRQTGSPDYYIVSITSTPRLFTSEDHTRTSQGGPLLSQSLHALPLPSSERPRPRHRRPTVNQRTSSSRSDPPPFEADSSPPKYKKKDPYRHSWNRGLARFGKQVHACVEAVLRGVWKIVKSFASCLLKASCARKLVLQILGCRGLTIQSTESIQSRPRNSFCKRMHGVRDSIADQTFTRPALRFQKETMGSRTDSALREIWDAYLFQRPLPTLSPARPASRTHPAPAPNDIATSNAEALSPPKKPTPPRSTRFGRAVQIGERTRKRMGAAIHSFLTWLVWKCQGLKDQVEGWFLAVKNSTSKNKDDDKEEVSSTFAESVRSN